LFAVVNDVAGCKLGSSTGPDCEVLGCAFAAIGDGFKLRLVEGEEDIATEATIRPEPGKQRHEIASLERTGCAYRV